MLPSRGCSRRAPPPAPRPRARSLTRPRRGRRRSGWSRLGCSSCSFLPPPPPPPCSSAWSPPASRSPGPPPAPPPFPAPDGWPPGSWVDDWRPEMAPLPRDEAQLTILAVGARDEVHHRGRATAVAREFLARVNPACELPAPPPLGRPELGRIRVFFTD